MNLYTTSAAAKVLGVTSQMVLNYAKQGVVEPYKLANGWYVFSGKQVDELKAHREKIQARHAAA